MTSFLGTASSAGVAPNHSTKPSNAVVLHEYIDQASSFCLNEDAAAPFGNLFIGDSSLSLKSDCDEQLILQLGFREPVNIQFIEMKFPSDMHAPKTIKLFKDKNVLS